ncbi:hypothetical protein KUCAC02_020500, partial [Chaenocephalus aceratus]
MSVRDGAATMATTQVGGGGGGDPDLLQPQSSERCNNGLRDLGRCAALGAGPRTACMVLAEVKECGGRGNHDGTIHYVHLPPVSKEQEAQLAARGFLPPPQDDFADLCNLPALNEDSILTNLRTRFHKKKIYTYAGSILIAINPLSSSCPSTTPSTSRCTRTTSWANWSLTSLHRGRGLLRHAQEESEPVHRHLRESGSGKTQSTNFLIHCLTALSQKGYASGVERTILGAGPVLEAFGNAKTAHNNNSSRFGKFIQVNYLESGVVRGAVVEKYLLEKSRLVSREKNERNYHVFTTLLLGASEEERKEFKLLPPEEYFYLKQQNFKIEDEEDLRHDFERLQQAMEMVGFLPATKKQIFSVLSAILYLGNVTYRRKSTGRDEGLDVGPPEVLATLSDLLMVEEELLVEALTKRKTVTVNDKLILPYSHSEAITARDSMAKSLYSALFDWIVLRINHALLNKKDMEESVPEEYQAEGITWHNIDYTDNVGCIHLTSKKPTGLLYLLDEESNFPHATDETLLAKFKQQHQGNKYFVSTPVMEPAFVIQHFAGKVKYQIKDFREKNTDHMRPDIVALLRSSDRAFVRQLIGMEPGGHVPMGILRATVRGLAAFNEAGRVVRPVSRTPLGELQRSNAPVDPNVQSLLDSRSLKFIVSLTLHDRTTKSLLHVHKKKKPPSISAQFQTSLTKLLETLNRAEPFFIRCIRSNAEKKEMHLDEALVLQQLRYTGMLETVRIRRSGYGAKYTFQEFIEQFRVLLPRNTAASKEHIAALLGEKMGLDHTTYQIGKTKVFLKELERQQLQDTLHKDVMRKIIFLQRWFRGRLQRKEFLDMRQAAILIQAVWRGHRQRAENERQRQRVTKIQALVRGHSARRRKDPDIELFTEDTEEEEEETNGEGDQQTASTPASAEQKRSRAPALNRAQTSKSQEKREQRRRRGLEHNQRETERAASSSSSTVISSKDQSSPPKSKSKELKERADSKELDQYTFERCWRRRRIVEFTATSRRLISPSESLTDGSKGSSFRRKHQDSSDSTHSFPSTPDKSGGFFSKILKKRKEAQTPDNGELTLAQILNERPSGGE